MMIQSPFRKKYWVCALEAAMVFVFAVICSAAPAAPRIHDPSNIVKCGEEYWLFSTGPGVLSWHSQDRETWERGPQVFTNAPTWAEARVPGNRGYFWAPDIIKVGDGYFLYYSISTWGKNTSVIALATNATLNPSSPQYRWVDQGPVVVSVRTNDYNAIDPSVLLDRDGSLWMAFGSFWSGIKLVELNPRSGAQLHPAIAPRSLANSGSIEAACLYRHADDYILWVNWGECCKGTNSTYEMRVGRSKKIAGPYRDQSGRSLTEGGGSLFLESQNAMIGPGHAGVVTVEGEDWISFHYYDATRRGMPTLGLRRLEWSPDGWPTIKR